MGRVTLYNVPSGVGRFQIYWPLMSLFFRNVIYIYWMLVGFLLEMSLEKFSNSLGEVWVYICHGLKGFPYSGPSNLICLNSNVEGHFVDCPFGG